MILVLIGAAALSVLIICPWLLLTVQWYVCWLPTHLASRNAIFCWCLQHPIKLAATLSFITVTLPHSPTDSDGWMLPFLAWISLGFYNPQLLSVRATLVAGSLIISLGLKRILNTEPNTQLGFSSLEKEMVPLNVVKMPKLLWLMAERRNRGLETNVSRMYCFPIKVKT